jgi:hypothetical protein
VIKKLLIPILISLIQIVGLAVIHDTLYHFYPMHHRSIGFGLTIRYTGILFSLLIIAFNFYLEFYDKYKYLIGLVLFLIVTIAPIQAYEYRPHRSLLLILMTLCGYGSSILINVFRLKINNKKNIKTT